MVRWNRPHSGLWTQELEPALFSPGHKWIAAWKGSTLDSICGDGDNEFAAIVNLHDREKALGEMSMSEKICMWLAWRLPRQLVYWCAIRVMTNPKDGSPDWTCADAAKAWLQAK